MFVVNRAFVAAAGCAFRRSKTAGRLAVLQPSSLGNAVVEHKGQWHIPFFREHRLRCQQVATSHRAKSAANVPRVILICTLLYSAIMTECKRPESIRYSVRLSLAQSERLTTLRDQLHARSNNDVFDYMVTVCSTRRDDLEHLVYSLFGDLAESLAHRFRSLETVSLLHPALTDTYIKCPCPLSPQLHRC